MKKNLLALFALGSFLNTNAQTVYVKDKAVVSVKSNTLLYAGNGMELSSSNDRQVINEGNVHINLSSQKQGYPDTQGITGTPFYFKNFNSDGTTANSGKNFVNTYTNDTSYGQVMFTANGIGTETGVSPNSSTNRIQGKMGFEQKYVSTASYNWLPIAFPFAASVNDAGTFGSVLTNTFGLTTSQYIFDNSASNNRYNSTVMGWAGRSGYQYNAVPSTKIIKEDGYTLSTLILNLQNGALKSIYDTHNTTTDRILYLGSPFSQSTSNQILATNVTNNPWTNYYTSDEEWSVWKERKNSYNERYRTYIGESFTAIAENSKTYGKYLLTFGNPFTHNFDLAQFLSGDSSTSEFKEDIKAIEKVGSSVTWNIKQGNTTAVQSTLIASVPDNPNIGGGFNPAVTSKQWTGDKAALILKPFEVAQFKLSFKHLPSNPNGNNRYYLYHNYDHVNQWAVTPKTFNYTSSATTTSTTPIAKTVAVAESATVKGKVSANDYELGLYQLGLVITNKEESIGNRVYFVALDKDITGQREEFELDYTESKSTTGIWANQENKDETFDDGTYLYINGFNMNDYVAKPLNITFYKDQKDTNNEYTITSNLAEGSTLNDELEKLGNGNKFYFVDKKENKSFEITKGFSYTFTATESANDRFVVYWNALPQTLGTGESEVNKNKTFIYKNGSNSNSIRFAKKNLTANIKVYNMTGQLVLAKDNVNTSGDFDMNTISNGMYVVTLEYSDGSYETLKSIFKK